MKKANGRERIHRLKVSLNAKKPMNQSRMMTRSSIAGRLISNI